MIVVLSIFFAYFIIIMPIINSSTVRSSSTVIPWGRKVKKFKSKYHNPLIYPRTYGGIRGGFAEILEPDNHELMANVKESRRKQDEYNVKELAITKLQREEAITICRDIHKVLVNTKSKPIMDGDKWGKRLRRYSECAGTLGWFSYIIFDGQDVYDFISKFYDMNELFTNHEIVERLI